MALDITTERTVDISDYGNDWDGCYLTVKSMNPKEFEEWLEAEQNSENAERATLNSITRDLLRKVLLGGVIMNRINGTPERYTLKKEDLDEFIELLDLTRRQNALATAAGTIGLKGL